MENQMVKNSGSDSENNENDDESSLESEDESMGIENGSAGNEAGGANAAATTEPKKRGPRGPYQTYTDKQWDNAVYLLTNELGKLSVSAVSRKYIKKFFREKPDAYMHDLQEAIEKDFNGLKVSEQTIDCHIKNHCFYLLQRLSVQSEDQYLVEKLEAWKAWVEKWLNEEAFLKHSVGVNLSVIGAICWTGVVDLMLWTPPVNKKCKVNSKGKVIQDSRGTTSDHSTDYLQNLMNTLDKNNMKGMNLVMDNSSIHKTEYI
ncbi:hypothetical protein CPC16_005690 [Podila verticillata]|nr:hypothetical protein CPC16_005690 [Podila verticillata]